MVCNNGLKWFLPVASGNQPAPSDWFRFKFPFDQTKVLQNYALHNSLIGTKLGTLVPASKASRRSMNPNNE